MLRSFLASVVLVAGAPLAAREPAPPRGLMPDRVVVMMRHGVRPPASTPPMPTGIASDPWPEWPVKAGYLSPHGRAAIAMIGRYDRDAWMAAKLIPAAGCPALRVIADSDERTIRTAESYTQALAPGCTVAIDHRPQDVPDPRFAAIATRAVPFDPAGADRAVIAAAGGEHGIARLERRMRPLLSRVDAILCAPAARDCGVAHEPSALMPAIADRRPRLTGALNRASTAAQLLLLEYTEGKPMRDVGWGRATPRDIERLGTFHAEEFRLLARPRPIARANLALLASVMLEALAAPRGPAVTMIAGHDTDIASLGGLLDVHWHVPGLAPDDPAPGGAIVLERLVDRQGRAYVRALYRSQTARQIRTLADPATATPYIAVLPIAGCTARGIAGLCTLDALRHRLTDAG